MERATGIEPATSTLARWRATNCAKPATQEVIYVRGTAVASENRKKFRPGEKSLLRAEKNFVKRLRANVDELHNAHPRPHAAAATLDRDRVDQKAHQADALLG